MGTRQAEKSKSSFIKAMGLLHRDGADPFLKYVFEGEKRFNGKQASQLFGLIKTLSELNAESGSVTPDGFPPHWGYAFVSEPHFNVRRYYTFRFIQGTEFFKVEPV